MASFGPYGRNVHVPDSSMAGFLQAEAALICKFTFSPTTLFTASLRLSQTQNPAE